jgi:hypothetical protein
MKLGTCRVEWMLTVVLGAGASFDSDPNRPPSGDPSILNRNRPPLAAHLFEQRPEFLSELSLHPACIPIVNRLRNAISQGTGLEEELAILEKEGGTNAFRWSQLSGVQDYLRGLILRVTGEWSRECAGATNYADFADKVVHWSQETKMQITFVSLNYDTLLEDALLPFGLTLVDINSYLVGSGGVPVVIKPHGSVNWWRVMGHGATSKHGDDPNAVPVFASKNDNYLLQSSGELSNYTGSAARLIRPAVAIPTSDKQDYVCPESHINAMRERFTRSSVVLVIGWSAMDSMMRDELKKHLKPATPVFVANGSIEESQATSERLRDPGGLDLHLIPLADGFTELVKSPNLSEVLRAAVSK